MADLVGQVLDRYEILELIDRGGMATVYRGRQPRLNRDVAVKVMLPALAADPIFRERFEREAQSIANLRHPNILTVYDYGETDDGQLYLVVDCVTGGTLRDRLGEEMPLEVAVEIVAQVAEALDYAHQQGVIHRDIKPNNILLTQEGRPLLADFGLAKSIQGDRRLTGSGVMVGTPDYMAPEQARGLEIDGRADVYSLGVMLCEMLTGEHPFPGDTPIDVIFKHLNEPMPFPSELNPNVYPALDEIVLKATAKSPDERYQRAGDMARALRATLVAGAATKSRAARDVPLPTPPLVQREEELSPQEALIRYHQILDKRFDEDELIHLCFALGVEYEDLPTRGQANKARELIRYLGRRQRLPELVQVGAKMRPDIDWPAPPAASAIPGPTPLQRKKWLWAALGGLLLLAVAMALLLPSILSDEQEAGPVGGVPTAQPGETMILVAEFKAQAGVERYDVSQRIYDKLYADLRQLAETDVSVYQVDQVVESHQAAVALGQQYGATTVIWGYYDDIGISPNVEAVGSLEDSLLSVGLERFNVDVGEAMNFKLYIAKDLPEELSFLTAMSLFQAFIVQGRFEKAVAYVLLAVDNMPQDPQFRSGGEMIYFVQAMMAYFQGDLEGGLEQMNQAIAVNPNKALFYLMRANMHLSLGQAERALADADRGLALEPDNSLAFMSKVGAQMVLGDWEATLDSCNQIIALQPEEWIGYFWRSIAYFEVGNLAAALDDWNRVNQLDPGNVFVPLQRGLIYEKMGQTSLAAADYAVARDVDVASDDLFRFGELALGEQMESVLPSYLYLTDCALYHLKGETQKALGICDRGLELNPDYASLLWKRGQIYAGQGEWEAALADYSASIEADPNWPWVYYLRAQALIELGRTDEAQVDLARALELEPADELRQAIEALRVGAGSSGP